MLATLAIKRRTLFINRPYDARDLSSQSEVGHDSGVAVCVFLEEAVLGVEVPVEHSVMVEIVHAASYVQSQLESQSHGQGHC